jgi:hypothetical protein
MVTTGELKFHLNQSLFVTRIFQFSVPKFDHFPTYDTLDAYWDMIIGGDARSLIDICNINGWFPDVLLNRGPGFHLERDGIGQALLLIPPHQIP